MLIADLHIDPLLHSKTRFLIILLLMDEEQSITSIAAKLNMRQIDLDAELSKLQDAGYIEAKTDVWKSCLETRFFITEKGIVSFHNYSTALEKIIAWGKTQSKSHITDFCVKVNGKDTDIRMNDIIYIKSCGNYVKINTDAHTYVSPITTSKVEQLLAEKNFIRIHKSYIVNTSKITGIADGKVQLSSIILPIGKTFKKFIEEFGRQHQLARH